MSTLPPKVAGRSIRFASAYRVHILRLSIALFVTACGGGSARFTTQTAAGLVPAPHTVSVLGVYKDGRMALGSWNKLAPHFASALGSAPCEIGFDALVTSNQDLANSIDEYARDQGPTSQLLTALAPAARGDLLMVVTLASRPLEDPAEAGPPVGAPVPNGMVTQRKRHSHGQNAAGNAVDPNRLEVSASLFSVTQNHPVLLVSLSYAGQNTEDALTRFSAELARAIPNSRCVGWNWDVKIDPAMLRTTVLQ